MTDHPAAKHEPDLMGGPEPDEEHTDVMRGPDYTTEEDQNPG